MFIYLWNTMKKVISERVETSSLIIREGMTMDIQFLNKICESWDDKRLTEGHDFEPGFIEKCINEGDLPPISDASKERYSFKVAINKANTEIIGFIDLYHGYPDSETLWISTMVIDSQHKKKGYGGEIIEAVAREAAINGYKYLGLGVYIQNLTGLRFWFKNGFEKIIDITKGDNNFTSCYSVVKLKKEIKYQ